MSEAYPTRSEKWAKKLDVFFEKIAILEPDDEMKARIAIETKEDVGTSRLYWLQLVLSSLIGVLGLIQNSVAVIIGAMLIAPFFWPIQCIAYGIINGENKITTRAIRVLFLSMCVSISIGFFVTTLIGFNQETSEIIARTQPTILDLLIALASGILAFLSLRFQKLSTSIAGVAMASAILPPLLVVGIEWALEGYLESWKALFLFLTNLVAIVAAGIFMFVLYGYSAHVSRQLSTVKNSMIVFSILIIMVAPLVSSLVQSVERSQIQHAARDYLQEILTEEFGSHKIRSFFVRSKIQDQWSMEAEIILPEWEEVYIENQDAIESYLRDKLQDSIDLDLIITRSVSLKSVPVVVPEEPQENTQDIFLNLKEEILQELQEQKNTTNTVAQKQKDYDTILTQTWKKILSEANMDLENVRISYVMKWSKSGDDFVPENIESIDFLVRGKWFFDMNTYDQIYTSIIEGAQKTFPFTSDITLELTPQLTTSFTIE